MSDILPAATVLFLTGESMRLFGFAAAFRSVAMLALVACSTAVFAQSAASVAGTVTDQQGRPLPGAVVVAQHQPTGTSVETTTGTDGRFSLAALRAGGPYRITVTMAGFALQERL